MNKRSTPLPPPSFGDPIWTIEHIALAVRQSVRSARTLAATDGFPPSLRLGTTSNSRKYWVPTHVLAYLNGLVGVSDPSLAVAHSTTETRPGVAPVAADPTSDAAAFFAALPTTRKTGAQR